MPSTLSRAATKCISDVPGLVKQTSTLEATRVRTRLSAPFILDMEVSPWIFFGFRLEWRLEGGQRRDKTGSSHQQHEKHPRQYQHAESHDEAARHAVDDFEQMVRHALAEEADELRQAEPPEH